MIIIWVLKYWFYLQHHFGRAGPVNSMIPPLSAKAGHLDHISPRRLQFAYTTKQQILNSGFFLVNIVRPTMVKVADFSSYITKRNNYGRKLILP